MILYAIRHKPTQAFMPARMFRTTARGWSYWEPTGQAGLGGDTSVPRLFSSKHAASVALSYWLKGKWASKMQNGNSWDEPPYDVQHGTDAAPAEIPRVLSDMEIVVFHLQEQKP